MTRHVQHITLLVILEALGTQRHTLIQRHVVADNRGLSDHHTRAVVYREILTDLSTRMNIDTRLRVSLFGDDTRNHRHLQLMQLMGDAIMRHRVHTGITEDHLTIVRCSWIVVKQRLHIGIEQTLDLRQRSNKLKRQSLCLRIDLFLRLVSDTILTELETMGYLFG